MGSCFGTCLKGRLNKKRGVSSLWGEKLYLVGYLWESARTWPACVRLRVSLFVYTVFFPSLVRGTAA